MSLKISAYALMLLVLSAAAAAAQAPTVTTDPATAVGSTDATLNGKVLANGNFTTVWFEYGVTIAYGRTVAASPSLVAGTTVTPVSMAITGLNPNTTYHFRVAGQSNLFGRVYGSDMTFTTPGAAPSVTTDTATAVTITGATLNGTVNANGSTTTVTFEYGTTSAYGTTVTADQSPITGSTNTAVSKAITGLTPNVTYHFRAVGTNSSGTTFGADMTFYTSTTGPTVSTEAATGISSTGATLNGTVNANNNSTMVTFEYGYDTSYGRTVTAAQSPVTGATNTAVSKILTALIPNTTYHFRAVVENSFGATYGADMTFTTTAAPPTVSTNAASGIGATGATINGTVNANNDSTTVTFEYGTTVAYGTTVTADQSPVTGATNTAVSKGLTGLITNTTYHFRVVGQNGSGTSNGADMTFTTGTNTPTISTITATGIGTTAVTLNGMANANGASTTVTFEFGFDTSYGRTATADQSPVTGATNTAVTATISGLVAGTTYHFRAVGQNGFGTTYGADMTFTTAGNPPSVTTDAATAVAATSTTLNGTVNANNDSTAVTFEYGPTIAYGTTVTADQSPVTGGTNAAVSKAITGLIPNTTYHYRAVGQNTFGTTNGVDMAFTTAAAPPTVTTDAATAITTSGATLNGTVNANNDSSTATFEYGLTTAYGMTVTADQSPVTGTTNTAVSKAITGLTPNTTYHYRAVGQNVNGTTNGADETFTTVGVPPSVTTNSATTVGSTDATVNGTVNANNDSTTSTFEYGLTTAYGMTVTADQSPVTGTTNTAMSKAITGLIPNTTYHFRAVGQNGTGTTNGADMTFTTNVIVPSVTTQAASAIGYTSATLNGTITDLGVPNATEHGHVWDINPGPTIASSKTMLGPPPSTGPFASPITGLNSNTTYYVRAYATSSTGTVYGNEISFATWVDDRGSLQVFISPQQAVNDGAGWRRMGANDWRKSGETEKDIPQDELKVEFKKISGWIAPTKQTVSILAGKKTTLTGIYTRKSADLKPVIHYFTATPNAIGDADSTMLNWMVKGADTIEIDNGVGAIPSDQGSLEVTPGKTKTYHLTATNSYGKTTGEIMVSVVEKPSILWFSSSTSKNDPIFTVSSAVLSWGIEGATEVTIAEKGVLTTPASNLNNRTGSMSVSPGVTTTYVLAASNSGGVKTKEATVYVSQAPQIVSFSAAPGKVAEGSPVTFHWEVKGAEEISIEPEIGIVTGNQVTQIPSASADYVLMATNSKGMNSATVNVQVVSSDEASDLVLTIMDIGDGSKPASAAVAGEMIPVTIQVDNNGPADAESFFVSLFEGERKADEEFIKSLKSGESSTVELDYLPLSSGKKMLQAIADAGMSLADIDRSNNQDEASLKIGKSKGVDLVVSDFMLTASPGDGKDYALLSYVITNVGGTASPGFQHQAMIMSKGVNKHPVAVGFSLGLDPGKSLMFVDIVDFRKFKKGFNLSVIADSYYAIPEQNKENNILIQKINTKDIK